MDASKDFKKYKLLQINQLVKADWNYKEDDDEKKEKLKNNIKRNGQVENIIVRELETGFYEVVNGNHRYDAMKELGYTNIIVCDKTPMKLSEAKRIATETNETRFNSDQVKLAELFKELSQDFTVDELHETMPYSIDEINNFTTLTDFDWSQYDTSDIPSEPKDEKLDTTIVVDLGDMYTEYITQKGDLSDKEFITRLISD